MSWNAEQMIGARPAVTAQRDVVPSPSQMTGFTDGSGLVAGGVTGMTALGLSAVWRSLDILSNGVSQLEWHERRGNLDLPPSRIVNRPQSERTRREWVSIVVSTLALYDVCYLLKTPAVDSEGVPIGLLYLQPSIVMPKQYDLFALFPPTEYYVLGRAIDADQLVVLHRSPQPDIFDSIGGVIRLARATFATAISAEHYASRYWQAGGPVDRTLETDAKLTPTEAQGLSDRWREKRAMGPDYVPVMDSGLKLIDHGVDPTAQSAVDARRELVADIGRYFGIPTHVLNAPNGDRETYSSTEASNQDLIRYTLQNYIGAIEDAISDQLPGGRHLELDTWPLRSGTMLATAQAFQLATAGKAWMDPNEDVRPLLGLAPVENPEKLNPPPPTPVVAAPGGNQNGG